MDEDQELKAPDASEASEARRRHTSRRHRRSHHRNHWSTRSRLLLALLVVALLGDFFGFLRIYVLSQENRKFRAELEHSQQELQALRPQLEQLEQNVQDLLEGRLPALNELVLNKVIPLDDGYLKNITFSRVKDKKMTGYEYKLVMENKSVINIWPEATLYFFDDSGLQVGVSRIGSAADSEDVEPIDSLGPGEVRSHHDVIALGEDQGMPSYFLIRRRQEMLEKALLNDQ